MANLDDLKKKAKDALNTIADVSVEAYKVAEEKAKVVARRAKLNAEIAREKALIRRSYSEIGKAYYNLHGEAPDDAFKDSCDDITAAFESIEAKKAEIEDLKAGNVVYDNVTDFEQAQDQAQTQDDGKPEQDDSQDNSGGGNSGW